MPAALTRISLLLLLLTHLARGVPSLTLPDEVNLGDELKIRCQGVQADSVLLVNTDFGNQLYELSPGENLVTITVGSGGVLQAFMVNSDGLAVSAKCLVVNPNPPAKIRLELNPRSEPVGDGRIQVLAWAWDQDDNPVTPPEELKVNHPEDARTLSVNGKGLLRQAEFTTSQRCGLGSVQIGQEKVEFRQVSGQVQAFQLKREAERIVTSRLHDQFGNTIEDGTSASCQLFRGDELYKTWDVSVLNGSCSFELEEPWSSDMRAQVEVRQQSSWLTARIGSDETSD